MKHACKCLYACLKWDKQLNKLFFIEFLFLLIAALATYGWLYMLNSLSDPIFSRLPTQGLESVSTSLLTFFFIFFITTLLLLLIYLFGFTLSRALAWSNMLERKLTLKIYAKFLALKLVWTLMWLPALLLLIIPAYMFAGVVAYNPEIGMFYQFILLANILLWLIIAYFGVFLYHSYFEHHKIYQAITDSFKKGAQAVKKQYKVLGTIILAWACFWVGLQVLQVIGVPRIVASTPVPYWIPVLLVAIFLFVGTRRLLVNMIEMSHK